MKKRTDLEWRPAIPEIERRKRDVLGDFVVRVVDGVKRRIMEVGGISFDPEGRKPLGLIVGVKVGGVERGMGIEETLAALQEVGIVVCEGSRLFVGEDERRRREKQGRKSSTMVVMIRGEEAVRHLYREGV